MSFFFGSNSSTSVTLSLSRDHSWVLAVVVFSWLVHNIVCSMGVMKARKRFGIRYPTLYATQGDGVSKEAAYAFNCVQRGHQNCLENLPSFLSLLFVAGARFPCAASISGLVYVVGRWVYFKGYSSGNPEKRMRGGFMYAGLLSLVGMVIRFAVELHGM